MQGKFDYKQKRAGISRRAFAAKPKPSDLFDLSFFFASVDSGTNDLSLFLGSLI
jgi:hypothetical protein